MNARKVLNSVLVLVVVLASLPLNGNLAYALPANAPALAPQDTVPIVVATVPVGIAPYGVGINPTTNRVYVANFTSSTVSVIDDASNTVVATVPVGTNPYGVGVNPTTNRVYVANSDSNTVSVIDGASNTIVATVPVGTYPVGVGVNPTTNRVYVANYHSNTVSVIDGASHTVVATVPVGSWPLGVGVNPTTNRVYVANYTSNTVSVIDGASNTVVVIVPVGTRPYGVGVNPTTNRVYVSNEGSGADTIVSVIDGASNTVVATVTVGSHPVGVDVNPTTNRVYVANWYSNTVSVIDGASNTVVATVTVGSNPWGVGVNPMTNRVYVSNVMSNTVSVIQEMAINLHLTPAGNGTGTVTSNPSGIDCGTDCAEAYALGTTVTLTATADSGSTFAGWSGCDSVSGDQCTMTMTMDKTVTATFTHSLCRVLALDAGTDFDTEALDLVAIPYTPVSPAAFASADLTQYDVLYVPSTFFDGSVTQPTQTTLDALNARADAIAIFVNNGGSVVAFSEPIGTGRFTWAPGAVTPSSAANSGAVILIEPSHPVASGLTSAALSAWGASFHHYFTSYDPALTKFATRIDGTPITLVGNLGSGRVVYTAQDPDFHSVGNNLNAQRFVSNAVAWACGNDLTLTVAITGTGSGTVIKSPDQISYTAGTVVTLTATADSGSTFAGWAGCDSVSGNQCTVTMTANKSITATFNLNDTPTPTPTMTPTPTVTPTPTDTPIDQGTLPSHAGNGPAVVIVVGIKPGIRYRIMIAGTYYYDIYGGRLSDAQWNDWQRTTGCFCVRESVVNFNGVLLEAEDVTPPDHDYTFFWTAASTQLEMYIWDIPGYYEDNAGALNFQMFEDPLPDTPTSTPTVTPTPTATPTPTQTPTPTTPPSSPHLYLSPADTSPSVTQIFTVEIKADTASTPADTVDAYLDFDPALLQVVDASGVPVSAIEPNTTALPNVSYNAVNNTTGRIDFSASNYTTPLSGIFTAATIRFKATTVVTSTGIVFARSGARWSDLIYEGERLVSDLSGTVIHILPMLPGRVTLEKRGLVGNPRWITPLYRVSTSGIVTGWVRLYQPGTTNLIGVYSTTTDAAGRFTVTLEGMSPGVYDAQVKGANTLSNKQLNVSLPTAGEIDLGTLRVGDSSGDDRVNGGDVSYMIPSFVKCTADAAFRPYADTNNDGCINGADVSALIPNFTKAGPIIVTPTLMSLNAAPAAARTPQAGASLILSPTNPAVQAGDVFTLNIVFDTGASQADTVDAYIDFDPASLEVVDATGAPASAIRANTSVLPNVTYNVVNNPAGQIDFSAYKLTPLSGTFTAATLRFRAKAAASASSVNLVRSGGRVSDLYYGESINPALGNASVNKPTAVTLQNLSASAHGEANGLLFFAALFALAGLGAAQFARRVKGKAQP